MTSLQYFDNISFHISPKNKKLDISKIYMKLAVEKCPLWNFQTTRKPRNSTNKSGNSFGGHPVVLLNFHQQNLHFTKIHILQKVYILHKIYILNKFYYFINLPYSSFVQNRKFIYFSCHQNILNFALVER